MYDEHFGLTGRPFQLTPDPAFWYETATHRRAMAYLGYGLAQGEGFIVITGDIGAGKTTLVGHLLDTLDREALNPIQLVSTAIEAADLLRIVATRLGVDPAGMEKAQLLLAIERGLHAVARTGRRTLLIVDEAQALPTSALEELRMLSNFQAGGHALLQIVLLGQPEFRSLLRGGDRLEQLRQRVIAIHHLDPMGAGEVAAYVRHRLSIVGWTGRPQFADSAFAALHRHSDGVPRRLNQLANRVMLHAAVEGIDLVTAATIETVAADLFADLPTIAPEVPSSVVGPAPIEEVVEDEPVACEVDHALAVAAPPELPPVGEAMPFAAPPVQDEERAIERPADVEPIDAAVEPVAAEPARPFRHSWLSDPESVPAAPEMAPAVAAPVAEIPPAADLPPVAEVEPAAADDLPPLVEAEPPAAEPASADAMVARLAALEARIEEQDAALRRVLTLMVDWVEGGEPSRVAEPIAPASAGYVPIRGAAAA